MTGLCARFPQSKRFGKYYLSYLPWDAPARIEVISGACMMVRREAFDKVGLLDEDYFMYGEDIDLPHTQSWLRKLVFAVPNTSL